MLSCWRQRTSEALTSTTNDYRAAHKLSSITQGATTVRSFGYDAAGNITSDTRGSTVYTYRYNNRNRLDELSIDGMITADYTYDGLERLAIRTTQNMAPAGTTHYVYDFAGHLLAESTDSGQTTREYIWLDDMPLAVVADVDTSTPHLYYVHADHLDRPLKMTDGSEAVVWDAVYNPFGDVNAITGSVSNNLRFPGQYFLIESGLHYNWYRHYDPTIGRYTQPDPLSGILATVATNSIDLIPTQLQNDFASRLSFASAYQYVEANPIALADPKGLQASTVCIAGGPANPACEAGIALDIIRGLCIGVSMYVASTNQSGGPLQRCLRAAESSEADWASFCGSIPLRERNNVVGEGSARGACLAHQFSSRTEKRNWCQNQYGKG